VLLVEGARQVGKSSLVEYALSKSSRKSYKLNLERDSRFGSMVDGLWSVVVNSAGFGINHG